MKKLLVTVALALIAVLTSFISGQSPAVQAAAKPDQKAVIVFFSRPDENYSVGYIEEGNTKKLAKLISQKTGAELVEIIPVNRYPTEYFPTTEQIKKEYASNYRPPIQPVKDISGYDIIFLGHPIWWGEVPPPVRTWLDSVDLKGKTVIPFVTHEGSKFGSSRSNLKELAPGATLGEGLAIYGHDAQKANSRTDKEVDAWLKKNGF